LKGAFEECSDARLSRERSAKWWQNVVFGDTAIQECLNRGAA